MRFGFRCNSYETCSKLPSTRKSAAGPRRPSPVFRFPPSSPCSGDFSGPALSCPSKWPSKDSRLPDRESASVKACASETGRRQKMGELRERVWVTCMQKWEPERARAGSCSSRGGCPVQAWGLDMTHRIEASISLGMPAVSDLVEDSWSQTDISDPSEYPFSLSRRGLATMAWRSDALLTQAR